MKKIVLLMSVLAVAAPWKSMAEVLEVTNVSDSGPGSLRQAILDANIVFPTTDTIVFKIPGSGPFTIGLLSALPDIIAPVIIDATTQAGYNGTPVVELDGSSAGANADGFFVAGGQTTIRGFTINRFDGDGILLFQFGFNVVEGNYIGTDPTGTIALPNNGSGVSISESSDNVIGGTAPWTKNLLSGNNESGVYIAGAFAERNSVQGNYIGSDVWGAGALQNAFDGVTIDASSFSTVGGAALGAGNLISGNQDTGVYLLFGAWKNAIQGNFIGTKPDGVSALANKRHGISIGGTFDACNNNSVGGFGTGEGNVIAYSTLPGYDGVHVFGGTGNAIFRNSIFGHTGLGIDLGVNGVTLNDVGDADSGPNGLQNFPVLTSAVSGPAQTVIQGTLDSQASKLYKIGIYTSPTCSASTYGEGQTFLGTTVASTGVGGTASFTLIVPFVLSAGTVVTATATDPSNNTSEFSKCFTVTGAATSADLQISKTGSPNPVQVGQDLTYTIVVKNNGPDTAYGVRVADVLAAGVEYVSATPTPASRAGNTIHFSLGALANGASTTITIHAKTHVVGSVPNNAWVSALTPDSVPGNNAVLIGTTSEVPPVLSITRSGSSVVVSWPILAGAFTLQESPTVAPSVWLDVLGPFFNVGLDITYTVASPSGNKFFRLRKP